MFTGLNTSAQSKPNRFREILMHIPIELFTEITKTGMDSLLAYGYYDIPGGNENDSSKYVLEIISDSCMTMVWYFTTGQRGFNRYELSTYTLKNGNKMVAFCSYGGGVEVFQKETLFYQFNGNSLVALTDIHLPARVDPTKYMKKSTPQDILTKLYNYIYCYYSIDCESQSIIYNVSSALAGFEWIESTSLVFHWNGKEFVKPYE